MSRIRGTVGTPVEEGGGGDRDSDPDQARATQSHGATTTSSPDRDLSQVLMNSHGSLGNIVTVAPRSAPL